MYFFLPIRRIIKSIRPRNNATKREKAPLSLKECMESTPAPRRRICRPWFILIFVIPVLCYMFLLHLSYISPAKTTSVITNTIPLEKGRRLSMKDPDYVETMVKLNEKNYKYIDKATKERRKEMKHAKKIEEKERVKQKTNEDIELKINRIADIPNRKTLKHLPLCHLNTTDFGRITVNKTAIDGVLEMKIPIIKVGGYHTPKGCQARHKVAFIVPFRDREVNLAIFLFNIHPFLIKQKLEYQIFVIEQAGKDKFNKGRLYNAGFKEMQKYGKWHCVVFHDVDLLPMDERILYTCPSFPRHMCASVLEKKFDNRYRTLFGGVTSMSLKDYEKCNGYSNMYWGWGGEDDDMFWRLRATNLPVVRYNRTIAEYTALPHKAQPQNKQRYLLLHTAVARHRYEGLSTVQYKVLSVKLHHLYTHILVDINPNKEDTSVINTSWQSFTTTPNTTTV